MEIDISFKSYLIDIIKDDSLLECIPEIVASFETRVLKKNYYLVKQNNTCEYFCYLHKGVLQHTIEVENEEKTTYLALKNSSTSSLKSFLNNTPSNKSIRALSECELKVIKIDSFKYLMENNKAFHKFYYNLLENQIFKIDDYRVDLLTNSPEQRYAKLLKQEPDLLQKVPVKYLASFLGISSRHMSRIRSSIR
jgi:CRP-like cAMP-binding protein